MKKLTAVSLAFIILIQIQSCGLFNGSNKTPTIKLIPFRSSDGKIGFFDLTGKIQINPQFSRAYLFTEGLSAVQNSEGKFGFIDEDGKYIVNPQYKDANPFEEGLAGVVSEGGKCQYINTKGEVKLTIDSADVCGAFSEGLAWVNIHGKFGFIDQSGKIIISPQFDNAMYFSQGLCPVMTHSTEGNSWGYIDTKGSLIINYQFKDALPFRDGLAAVSDGKIFGYINKEGKYTINPQFKFASYFRNGLAVVREGDEFGYINKEGKLTINPQFKYACNFSDNGLAMVYSDNKCGYIDKQGKYVINPQYEFSSNFFGEVALAGTKDKLGLIDTKGVYKVNPQFNVDPATLDYVDIFDSYKSNTTQSDFFDKADLINTFLDGTSKSAFKNMTDQTTTKQVRDIYAQKSEAYADNYFDGNASPNEKLGNSATLFAVHYNYSAPQSDNAVINFVEYRISLFGKAYGKEKDIIASMADEIATRTGGKVGKQNENLYQINGGTFPILSLSLSGSVMTVTVFIRLQPGE